MGNVFDCVNRCLYQYLEGMKGVFSNGQGGYKNVLYPDLEVASDSTKEQMQKLSWVLTTPAEEVGKKTTEGSAKSEASDDDPFAGFGGLGDDSDSGESGGGAASDDPFADVFGLFGSDDESGGEGGDDLSDIFGSDDDLMDIFSSFGSLGDEEDEGEGGGDDPFGGLSGGASSGPAVDTTPIADVGGRILEIQERAKAAVEAGANMPFYVLTEKLGFDPFTIFCFACGILSSTQTDYSAVFQIINESGGMNTPTIESAGKLYYGNKFSITGAYGDMSVCLEQMQPILDLRIIPSMPFSTPVSPDKRIIDYLFGKYPMKLDENYSRFLKIACSRYSCNCYSCHRYFGKDGLLFGRHPYGLLIPGILVLPILLRLLHLWLCLPGLLRLSQRNYRGSTLTAKLSCIRQTVATFCTKHN